MQHQAVAEHTLGVSRLLSKSWERIVERLCEKCGMSTVTLIESHTGALSMHAHTRALQMHAHTSTTWYMSRRIYSSVNKLRKTPSVNKITPALVSCRCTQAQCVGTPTCQKIRGRALVLVNKSSNRTGSGEAARARRRVRRGCTCVYLK